MIGAGFRFFVLFGLLVLASATSAQTFVDPEVIEAAYAVANFKSTPRQEALVFMHNKDLNLLALQGKIPPEVYQRNQSFFEMVNKGFVKDAAAKSGLVAKTQTPKPGSGDTFNPGTDTDIIVEKKPGAPDITEKQILDTEKAYQDKVREYLQNSGVDPPDGKINTDTDFMPHPDHTSAEEFTKINEGINKRGGTAYENPDAARVEAKTRSKSELSIEQTGAYVTEMQNLANHKIADAARIEAEAAAIRNTNPARAQKLDAEAGWYLYAVGHEVPQAPSPADKVRQFTRELDELLRREHHEDYCAIVYADDLDAPNFVKIYDPNHLGSSCGSSSMKSSVLPGWLMSKTPPREIQVNHIVTGQRKRWWQAFLGG